MCVCVCVCVCVGGALCVCVCVCVCVCRGRSAPKLNPIDPSASRMGVEQVQSPASWWYCDVRWFMIGHKIVFIFFFPTK